MMTVKKFGILSVGNISGILSAIMGLILGFFYALFLTFFIALSGDLESSLIGFPAWGVGMIWLVCIVGFTIGYGIFGFLTGLISAALYNVFCRWIGGIKVDLSTDAEVRL